MDDIPLTTVITNQPSNAHRIGIEAETTTENRPGKDL